eukprot:scaffold42993_cov56-Phaeocystis_antarctica.AAC.4
MHAILSFTSWQKLPWMRFVRSSFGARPPGIIRHPCDGATGVASFQVSRLTAEARIERSPPLTTP